GAAAARGGAPAQNRGQGGRSGTASTGADGGDGRAHGGQGAHLAGGPVDPAWRVRDAVRRRTEPLGAGYSTLRPGGIGSTGGGIFGFRSSRVSATIRATARFRNQLRLAGMTYQGAASVEQFVRASSK